MVQLLLGEGRRIRIRSNRKDDHQSRVSASASIVPSCPAAASNLVSRVWQKLHAAGTGAPACLACLACLFDAVSTSTLDSTLAWTLASTSTATTWSRHLALASFDSSFAPIMCLCSFLLTPKPVASPRFLRQRMAVHITQPLFFFFFFSFFSDLFPDLGIHQDLHVGLAHSDHLSRTVC